MQLAGILGPVNSILHKAYAEWNLQMLILEPLR